MDQLHDRGGRKARKKNEGGRSLTISEIIGYGVGVIGLHYDELMGLDLDDFYSISKAYSQKEESRFRESYERARFAAALVVGSFSGNVSPKRLCTFPWEKDDHEQERLKETKEEHRKRMADALKKWGSTY